MRFKHFAQWLILLATTCLAQDPTILFGGPAIFTSSVHDLASNGIVVQAFHTVSDVHTSRIARSRVAPYIATRVSPQVLLNIQDRGDHHFGRGRAHLYQIPLSTNEHGQVWISLVKVSSEWIELQPGQEAPPGVALVWQIIHNTVSLRGAFGISKTYANTVRNKVPAWRPIHHAVGGVTGFFQARLSLPRLGHGDPPA